MTKGWIPDEEFDRMLRTVMSPWIAEVSAEMVMGYLEALEDLPADDIRNAARVITKTRAREKGLPSPADFRAEAFKLSKERTQRQEMAQRDASKREAERLRELAPQVKHVFSRLIAEYAFDPKAWRPKTPLEREGMCDFTNLLHQAHGVFERPGPVSAVKVVRITLAHQSGLLAVGGFEALSKLEPHEVHIAQKLFVTAYAKAKEPDETLRTGH
jgi:hypothetical protein